uniref:SGNH hydrolase-type esterase domain-containing protein n=1 Tax=Candidatus Methanophagaceae archaeon ANME-1 ERB6 TaxID=2759912 RepID=A0A7G9YUL0_9EURY|nr:hypothetical protein GMKFMAKO_00010 [Methanosarcinales archaeon ANME-1 ERB6]
MLKNIITKLWKAIDYVSKVLVIVVIMLLILEVLSFGAYTAYRVFKGEGAVDSRLTSEVYQNQTWAEQYFKELHELAPQMQYYPYVGFRNKPNFHGKYINLNEESVRKTWNPPLSNDEKAIKVFFFGGSTVWSYGARDEYTVPSYLSKVLYEEGYSVYVTNFGEWAYTNTQELIRLQLELRKGNIPDIVIFYDGINDGISSYQSKIAGFPHNVEKRKLEYNSLDRLNNVFNIRRPLVKKSYTIKGIRFFLHKILNLNLDKRLNIDEKQFLSKDEQLKLAKNTTDMYFNNTKLIRSLEDEYGFKSYFFWQPTIFSKQNLSSTEKGIIENSEDPEDWEEFFDRTYSLVHSRINHFNSSNIYYIADIFDNEMATVFIDRWHISEEGNKKVADEIAKEIIEGVKKRSKEKLGGDK